MVTIVYLWFKRRKKLSFLSWKGLALNLIKISGGTRLNWELRNVWGQTNAADNSETISWESFGSRLSPSPKSTSFWYFSVLLLQTIRNYFLRISLPGIQTQRATLGTEKVEQRHFFQTDSSQGDKDTQSWCFWNLFTICQRFFQHVWSSQFLVQIRPNFSGPWNPPLLIRHPPLKLGFLVWRRFKWSAGIADEKEVWMGFLGNYLEIPFTGKWMDKVVDEVISKKWMHVLFWLKDAKLMLLQSLAAASVQAAWRLANDSPVRYAKF